MKPALEIGPMPLPPRSVYRIEDGEGLEVTAVSGAVWITQAGDPRDVILARGQSFILDRGGCALVYALKEAAIAVRRPGRIAAANRIATAA